MYSLFPNTFRMVVRWCVQKTAPVIQVASSIKLLRTKNFTYFSRWSNRPLDDCSRQQLYFPISKECSLLSDAVVKFSRRLQKELRYVASTIVSWSYFQSQLLCLQTLQWMEAPWVLSCTSFFLIFFSHFIKQKKYRETFRFFWSPKINVQLSYMYVSSAHRHQIVTCNSNSAFVQFNLSILH